MSRVEKLFGFIFFLANLLIFQGCANQQPPGGGEEDKTPPKVTILSPRPNSVNFRGRSLEFSFNEYVDRRSFQDAFRVSPAIKGDIEFNWGSKDVEVIFPGSLEKTEPNKTFVVNIGTGFMDIQGNPLTEPVSFAFSTGPLIDMAQISGRVFNNSKKTVSVFAYRIDDSSSYDPTKKIPDYFTETSPEGSYKLTNLASGNFRLIAIIDDDRNLLFTSERESFGVLPYDIILPDSGKIENANFNMKIVDTKPPVSSELDYTKYFKDSSGIVYTSVENDSRIVSPDQSIYIFFNSHKPKREDLVSLLKVTGEDNQQEKIVFNWKNDSLVEIFAANKFKSNFKYSLEFTLSIAKDSIYNFKLKFKTVGKNSFGEMKGSVRTNYENVNITDFIVKLNMETKDVIPVIKYSFDLKDTAFSISNILEAEYNMFSFIDLNADGEYNYGYPYPFTNSEPFFIFPQALRIRGGWTVENIVISFNK